MTLVLLDRDGVINHDSSDFIRCADAFIPIDGSIDAIARLHHAGFRVAVCSNQSGIGRGLFGRDALAAIDAKLAAALATHRAYLDGIFYCPHVPEDECDCRKPRPGLLHRAMRALRHEADTTLFIGDSQRDLDAAVAAGCRPVLVRTGNGATVAGHDATFDDLAAAADWLLATQAGPP